MANKYKTKKKVYTEEETRLHEYYKKHQLFRTPEWVWDCLIKQFPDLLKGDCLDPSAGDGTLMHKLADLNPDNHHQVIDIRKQELPVWHKNGLMKKIGQNNCWVDDYLQRPIHKKFDVIISNPPFNLAEKFIDKSLQYIKPDGHVIFLQRIDFLGSKRRALWFSKKILKSVIVITKRPTWILDNKPDNSSDTRDFCFFVFQNKCLEKPTIDWLFTEDIFKKLKVSNDIPFKDRQISGLTKTNTSKGFFRLKIGKYRK